VASKRQSLCESLITIILAENVYQLYLQGRQNIPLGSTTPTVAQYHPLTTSTNAPTPESPLHSDSSPSMLIPLKSSSESSLSSPEVSNLSTLDDGVIDHPTPPTIVSPSSESLSDEALPSHEVENTSSCDTSASNPINTLDNDYIPNDNAALTTENAEGNAAKPLIISPPPPPSEPHTPALHLCESTSRSAEGNQSYFDLPVLPIVASASSSSLVHTNAPDSTFSAAVSHPASTPATQIDSVATATAVVPATAADIPTNSTTRKRKGGDISGEPARRIRRKENSKIPGLGEFVAEVMAVLRSTSKGVAIRCPLCRKARFNEKWFTNGSPNKHLMTSACKEMEGIFWDREALVEQLREHIAMMLQKAEADRVSLSQSSEVSSREQDNEPDLEELRRLLGALKAPNHGEQTYPSSSESATPLDTSSTSTIPTEVASLSLAASDVPAVSPNTTGYAYHTFRANIQLPNGTMSSLPDAEQTRQIEVSLYLSP
jgi:hypothetical protein